MNPTTTRPVPVAPSSPVDPGRAPLVELGQTERISTLYRQGSGNYLVTLATATIVAVVLHDRLPSVRVWSWYGAAVLITLVRFALLHRFLRRRHNAETARTWAYVHVATSAAAGLLWGSTAVFLMVDDSVVLQTFLYIVAAGMMAGAALSLSVYPPAFLAFVLPIGAFYVLRLFAGMSLDSDTGRAHFGLALLLTGWIAVTAYFARVAGASYSRALRIDRENRKLDRALEKHVAEMEASNQTLSEHVRQHAAIEADLVRAKEQLDLALGASRLAIWDWSADTNLTYLDPSWSAMLGLPPEARHCTIAELAATIHPDDLRRARDAQVACLGGKVDEYAIEHRVRTASGGWIWIMCRGRVVDRDAAGRALRMTGTNLDITARKEAQERIEALNRTLEAKLGELAAANEALEDFASTVSHDLQAPLRRIDGFAAMFEARYGAALDAEGRAWLERMRQNSAKMSALIDDLLVFARSGRTELATEEVDLRPLVSEIAAELSESVPGRRIEWAIGELPRVCADARMLRIALSNLAGNAVKFTRPRPVARIEIGTLPGDGTGPVIFVRDNGVGFDPRQQDRLFGAFRRLHRDAEFEGTGIGLATVHRIIDRHGGRVWAESLEGAGATFYLALPVRAGSQDSRTR